ncbi:MAG: SDR family NAD(P)-dependent oxidoreductase [Sulfitobacter sp.]
MTLDLSSSTALVTGGARGIGLELSKQLVTLGCKVVAVGRNTQDLESLQALGPDAITTMSADLSSQGEVDALVVRLAEKHPEVNIVINNAGVQFEMDLFAGETMQATSQARREIAVNLDALVTLTVGLLPVIERHNHAAVVNISSGLALAPKAASPVYCATKAAVRSFTKALRYQCVEHAPHIQVSEVIMGLVDTDMTVGRGSGKISPRQAAEKVILGMQKQRQEIWIGRANMLRLVNSISPRLAERIMR